MKKLITLFAIAGLVLALAPAAQAQEIIDNTGFTATESYADQGSATVAVDGTGIVSGEGATGMHSGSDGNSALYAGHDGSQMANAWFKVDLGASYDLGKMYVWNGQPGGGVWDRGSGSADMYYSTVATTDAIPTGGASSGDWILITAAQALNPKADASVAYFVGAPQRGVIRHQEITKRIVNRHTSSISSRIGAGVVPRGDEQG
jgi:hypothetical protein